MIRWSLVRVQVGALRYIVEEMGGASTLSYLVRDVFVEACNSRAVAHVHIGVDLGVDNR